MTTYSNCPSPSLLISGTVKLTFEAFCHTSFNLYSLSSLLLTQTAEYQQKNDSSIESINRRDRNYLYLGRDIFIEIKTHNLSIYLELERTREIANLIRLQITVKLLHHIPLSSKHTQPLKAQ